MFAASVEVAVILAVWARRERWVVDVEWEERREGRKWNQSAG